MKYPVQFINNKLDFASYSLGIRKPLITSERGIHRVDEITSFYGAKDTEIQDYYRTSFIKFTDKIGILTLRPIMLLALCLLANIFLMVKKGNNHYYWRLMANGGGTIVLS